MRGACVITAAVEGFVDEAVVYRLIEHAGGVPGPVWLIADRERLAHYLGLAASRIPREPERLQDPKRTLVDLARKSRRREIREDMVPREGSGRSVGPAYSSRVVEFARTAWRPAVAAGRADSLRRAMACIEKLVAHAISDSEA